MMDGNNEDNIFSKYNKEVMKKVFLLTIVVGLFASCYDNYIKDYSHTTVAFSNATGGATTPNTLFRTVVVGEGLRLDAGVYLAGVRHNDKDRWVDFKIDPTLLDDEKYKDYELMPQSYYSLSEKSRFVIPKGEFIGKTTIELDSVLFTNDNNSSKHRYAIPIKLIATSEDSILSTQNFQILVIKYINSYEGYYEQTGTFKTISPSGEELNAGSIKNDLYLSTVGGDTVRTNGMIASKGAEYMMTLLNEGNKIFMEYFPNPNPVEPSNIALGAKPSTSYVSPWEKLDAINNGYSNPSSSSDRSQGIYGNWWSSNTWRYVQYDFDGYFMINQSNVYWFTDGGGLLMPTDNYLEYWDFQNEKWEKVTNSVGNGAIENQWNTTTFDPIVTDKIRLNMINEKESVGIIQWQVWGVPAAVGLEEVAIEKITPLDDNSFDKVSETFKLNYRVDYFLNDYHTDVSVTLKWRNRIRDGVNEWQR